MFLKELVIGFPVLSIYVGMFLRMYVCTYVFMHVCM
jgi:hypothetical protein